MVVFKKIKKHPVTTFFLLTFLASWLFWIPGAIVFGEKIQKQSAAEITSFIIKFPIFSVLTTIGAAFPSIVAIILIRKFYGKKVLQDVFSRYKKWRVSPLWYLVSITLIPLVSVISLVINSAVMGKNLFLSQMTPIGGMVIERGAVVTLLFLPVIFVSQLVSSPILEELGWRGFALPHMQLKFNATISSVLLGFLWGIWHLPLWISYDLNIVIGLINIVGYAIIMTWIFNSTEGNMLMALFFHASLNVSSNFISINQSDYIRPVLILLLVSIIIIKYGWRELSAKNRFTQGSSFKESEIDAIKNTKSYPRI